jgi:hypothetical protein
MRQKMSEWSGLNVTPLTGLGDFFDTNTQGVALGFHVPGFQPFPLKFSCTYCLSARRKTAI